MGQAISRRTFSFGSAAALLSAQTMGQGQAASPSSVTLIEGGIPRPLVIPDQPLDCVVYAARELAAHLSKATGTLPQIIPEHVASGQSTSEGFFFLGDTAIARASIDLGSLAPEACILRTIGGNFCIAGRDGPGDPLDPDVTAGTLFGVYHFLQNHLKVRWLWPGDLGTMVPKTASLIVPSLDEVVAPHLMQRHVRLFKPGKIDRPELGFSTTAAADYRAEERIFIRRHRMGRRQHIGYGHAFGDWWAKYGDQHPEWFQLVDGRRGPVKPGARFSMSIADPGLHQQIVTLWREKGGARRGASFINAVENDIPGLCECALCRALDSPPPPDYLTFIPPQSKMARHPFVTDRFCGGDLPRRTRLFSRNRSKSRPHPRPAAGRRRIVAALAALRAAATARGARQHAFRCSLLACRASVTGSAPPVSLDGTTWLLTDYISPDGQSYTVPAAVTPQLAFADGQLSGNAGCNTFNAPYTVTGDAIEVGPIMSTKMACQEPMATVEAAYLAALDSVNKVAILDDGKLQLWDDGGKTTLAFLKGS